MLAIILLVYAAVIIVEFIPAIKQKALKEKVIYGALMSISFFIFFLISIGIEVPGPSKAIENFIGFFIHL